MSGKGSRPRPLSISQKEFDANFDRIFGKKQALLPDAINDALANKEYFDITEMEFDDQGDVAIEYIKVDEKSPTGKV